MKITPEDIPPDNPPWNYPQFIIRQGRYYDRMGSIALPTCKLYPFGGDVTYMIWRYDDKPDEWVSVYRFRTYSGPNTDAFDGGDTKSWYAGKTDSVDRHVRAFNHMAEVAQQLLNNGRPVEHEVLMIEGDGDKFGKLITESPPEWMHKKTATVPQK